MTLRTAALLLFALFGAAIPASTLWGDPVEALLGTERLPRPLAEAIPDRHAGWSGRDLPLTAKERRAIQTDDALQRAYTRAGAERVTLYIAYWGNKQRGLHRYYHHPTICYRDAGWNLTDTRFEHVTLEDAGIELPVCRYLFERGGARISVTVFFKVDDELLDESPRNKPVWTFVEKLTPALSDRPGSLAQVQVVVPFGDEGEGPAAATTTRFLREFGRIVLAAVEPGRGR